MPNSMVTIATFFMLLLININCSITCMGPSNTAVDWFIILKAPAGTKYLYMDSKSYSKFTDFGWSLNDVNTSPIMLTLKQVKNTVSNTVGSIFWNDEPPKVVNTDIHAHSKGIIGFDATSGFTLSHSTPLFPKVINNVVNLEIESGQQVYGQHYICVTTSTSVLNTMAPAFQVDSVHVYAYNIPDSLNAAFPNFIPLAKMAKTIESMQIVNFKTLGGYSMKKFAKAHTWEVPFYENVVCSEIGVGLTVETWGNGAEGLEPPDWNFDRGMLPVISCLAVDYGNGYNWSYTKDHSQYAISMVESSPYVCFGDINRQKSQYKRGGGTICFLNVQIHKIIQTAMVSVQAKSAQEVLSDSFLKKE